MNRTPLIFTSAARRSRRFAAAVCAVTLAVLAPAKAQEDAGDGAAARAPAPRWTLRTADGAETGGAIERFVESEGKLFFRAANAVAAAELDTRTGLLLWRVLEPDDRKNDWAWRVRFANGDFVRCRTFMLANGELRLDSALFGQAATDFDRVRGVAAETPADIVYEGPWAGEHWEGASAKVQGNHLTLTVGNAPVGRKIGRMPLLMTLEATFSGAAMNRAVLWGGDELTGVHGRSSPSYSLMNIQLAQWSLHRHTADGMFPVGTDAMARPGASAPVRVRLFVNGEQRRIALYLGDRRVTEWEDVRSAFDPGETLVFQSVFSGRFMVSDIAIARWNGALPPDAGELSALTEAAPHLAALRNDDRVVGVLTSADGRSARFREVGAKELEIPMARIARIEFPRNPPEEEAAPAFARIRLADGSKLSLKIRRIENGEVLGQDGGGKDFRLPLGAIREILWPARSNDVAQKPGGAARPGAGAAEDLTGI